MYGYGRMAMAQVCYCVWDWHLRISLHCNAGCVILYFTKLNVISCEKNMRVPFIIYNVQLFMYACLVMNGYECGMYACTYNYVCITMAYEIAIYIIERIAYHKAWMCHLHVAKLNVLPCNKSMRVLFIIYNVEFTAST